MIKTEPIPVDELLEQIPAGAPLGIIGCGDCAAALHTGGTRQVDALREACAGRNPIAFATVATAPCDQRVLRRLIHLIQGFEQAQTIVLLACPAGAQSLATLLQHEKISARLVLGLKTTGLGWIEKNGKTHPGCTFCASCTYDPLQGNCPTARCPLRRQDGPCQNRLADDGCPVTPDLRCVWLDLPNSEGTSHE
ncbi:MAG TPA: methylenetetrahydrofolate reductase C-terminal domain-containing protein [Candidatus Ozemobacteraceae bacterium]|nr:methylenetetrahydrofolate reductase C-terminal domain-containing protein [Candidatus Ozemobacteraceae bacterium]